MSAINSKISDLESHTGSPTFIVTGQTVEVTGPMVEASIKTPANPEQKGVTSLCDKITMEGKEQTGTDIYRQTPSFGPISNGVHFVYSSFNDIDVCRQKRRTQTQLFAIGEQLIAWQRLVTNIDVIGRIFGKSNNAIREFSDNQLICFDFAGQRNPFPSIEPNHSTGQPIEPNDSTGQQPSVHARCRTGLKEIAEYYGRIPDSILGCITLYLLPCLYGFLGACAATMRYLRGKVNAYTVNFTERATVRQNLILGVVSGAVIGLFAAYLAKAGPAEGIGISALAFLAGYNVSGLFALFDDISNRIFRPGNAPTR